MNHALTILISIAFGAIPSAYLVTKIFFKKDITKLGSGNIGAMNTYESTGSKFAGILVFFMDVLKGVICLFAVYNLFDQSFYYLKLSALIMVLINNYNPFLRLKGGRGLALSVGILAFIFPPAILFWIIMYLSSYFIIKKNVHIANVGGTIGSFFLILGQNSDNLKLFSPIQNFDALEFKIFYFFLCLLILSKHIKPLRELYGK